VRVLAINMLTRKERKLLQMINDAEKMHQRITFYKDENEVARFEKKYGKTYVSLQDKGYVDGVISTLSELCMNPTGKKALYESVSENKKSRKRVLIDILIAIISATVSFLLTKFLS
jgi:hypothetical protein